MDQMGNAKDAVPGYQVFNSGDRPKDCAKLVSLTRYQYDAIKQIADRAECSMQEVIYNALEDYLTAMLEKGVIEFPDK